MNFNPKKATALFLSVLMIMSSILIPTAAFAKDTDSKAYVEGEAIVVLKDNAEKKYMKAASASAAYGHGYTQKGAYTFGTSDDALKVVVIKSDSLSTKQIIKQMRNNSAVKYAAPNSIMRSSSITDDELSKYQWALDNTGQNFGTPGLDTNADALWEQASKSEKEQVVAIVDTGIDDTNEELKDIMWTNPHGKKLLGKHGLDFTGTQKDREPHDDNGHGSHCAGIIAASANNKTGISGINTSNVKIMALKFLDESGSGTTEGALAAYDYLQRAIKLGTNVIACNNSWDGMGGAAERDLFDDVYTKLGKLGVITFVAAGNEAMDLGKPSDDFYYDEEYFTIPACCNSPYCVTVAATNEKDELADFSNYSDKYVDVAAPGTDILSTVSYDCFNPSIYTDEKKAELCAYYQNYDSEVAEGEFGSIKLADFDFEAFDEGKDAEITYGNGFGFDGKGIRLAFKDEFTKKRKTYVYAFEIPFTIADKNKDYSVSFMLRGSHNFDALVYDVPAEKTIPDIFDEDISIIDAYGGIEGNYWEHFCCNVDIDELEEDYDYEPTENRKLVFIVGVYEANTEMQLDDLAISTQHETTEALGKYDFYCGTSMATPYAAGAAALIKNASPESTTLDIINIIKNSGRSAAALEGKTQTGKVLSLDDISKIPPMITGAEYNKDKKIEITGSFVNISEVTVNGEKVEPISVTNDKIIIADNNYSTKKITIAVTNNIGTDSYTCFVSAKPVFNIKKLDFKPDVSGDTFALTAGGAAYFVTSYGSVYCSNRYDDDTYDCYDVGAIDLTKVFPKDEEGYSEISSVAYMNNTIYAVVIGNIASEYTGDVIGYETGLLAYSLETMETKKFSEIPDEAICGASLAVYNGDMYLLGGMDEDTYEFSDLMFKLDKQKKAFTKLATKLPEGRAFTNFIQYKNKLVGMYGANEKAELPPIIVYDGTKWKTSTVALESEDIALDLLIDETKKLCIYEGNLGYGENGVFANGSYIYNVGDTFTYDADADKVTPSKYVAKNSVSENALVGTTVNGGFIGFRKEDAPDEDNNYSVGRLSLIKGDVTDVSDPIDDVSGLDDYEPTEEAYTLSIKNEYPYIDTGSVVNGFAKSPIFYYFNYGEAVDVELVPDAGYVVTSIKFNGAVVSKNTNKATVVISKVKNTVTNTAKLVASPVTSLKVKSAKNGKIKLGWNKAKSGSGYQVQQYKGGKWVTVKTIKSKNTNTYTATVKVGQTAKYRVRTFGKNGSATIYGSAKVKALYVPKKQSLKSAKGAKGSFTVNYSKDAKASGYEIEFSKSNKFTSVSYAFANKAKTVKKTVKGVEKGKYFVRVRSYKKVDGVKIYGAYSKAKTITVN